MSNLIFIVVGGMGISYTFKNNLSAAWKVFFIGVFLVGPGSAYYHWAPSNATLVWDRLPMTIAFMGLLILIKYNIVMGIFLNRVIQFTQFKFPFQNYEPG